MAAVVAAPSFGIGRGALDDFFPWLPQGPAAPTLHPDRARLLFSVPWVAGTDASFWSVPNGTGPPCIATRLTVRSTGAPPSSAPHVFANDGLDCSLGGRTQPAGKIQTTLAWEAADGSYRRPAAGGWAILLLGHLPDGADVARVVLQLPAGRQPLTVADGYFAGRIPGTAREIGRLPSEQPYGVVGLDESGRTVARADLQALVAQTAPAPSRPDH